MTDQPKTTERHLAPKQMQHWARRHGLVPIMYRKGGWREYPLFKSAKPKFIAGCRDQKRFVRVLPHLDRMEICDGYMDRWANSHGAEVVMPKTMAQFDVAIETLLKEAAPRVRDTHPVEENANG
ncbi:hypothetical protein HOU02_gp398 [Caulobacter phage CcrBL9]|uniref:Uncharacterized protein n=1 Tax=Caulobacter phage CcrBL9 TaxID=2283270 RepID=A0A385EEU6_9CAUD|nr:hypothetical protein HOU02_gp398 [Caulobacter phage CcrBL9]AXQ69327.1 hypothetical protein CcrBL9_gp303 [Caulobacter phage CcrBL9]